MKKQKDPEWLFRLLAEGDPMLDHEVLCRFGEDLGLNLDDKQYFCLSVRFSLDMTASPYFVTNLLSACRHIEKQIGRARTVFSYIAKHLCVVMIAEDQNDRFQFSEFIFQQLKAVLSADIMVGVGRSVADIGRLSDSCEEAFEALFECEMTRPLSFIDDIYAVRHFTAGKMESEKEQILRLFRRGELDEMMERIRNLSELVRQASPVQEGMPYPTSIRRTVHELLTKILYIASDAGVDTEQILEHKDPYSYIFQLSDTPDILSWVESLSRALHLKLSSRQQKNEGILMTAAQKMIRERWNDPNLSLGMVSDELGITSSYFSALYRKKFKIGFVESLTEMRLAHAKKLLCETTVKIKAISDQCGFRSASYFISVFRKEEGISPGEYRKNHTLFKSK